MAKKYLSMFDVSNNRKGLRKNVRSHLAGRQVFDFDDTSAKLISDVMIA
jgi:hypothetical protein